MDADLEHLSRDELLAALVTLRKAVRAHRDCSGHDLCWHHPTLWNQLPEQSNAPLVIPEWPAFLRGCIRYRQSFDTQRPDAPRSPDEFDGTC